jgi:hypothetical protein
MLDRIVEVFCEVDDFCQAFLPQWEASLLGTGGPAPRGPQPGLSPSEIITLLLVLHSSGFKHLKSFYHGFAEPLLRGYFPGMPCYEHFVALQKSVFVPLVVFLHSHLGTKTGLYYIDSTALPVCDNHRINRHKVFAGLAQRGKTSMGWFFGFKLHLVFNTDNEIVALKLTPGNVHDTGPSADPRPDRQAVRRQGLYRPEAGRRPVASRPHAVHPRPQEHEVAAHIFTR